MISKRISIIITNYNSEQTIIETLKSISRQDFNLWECIIVDDCSKDNSVRVIKNYIKNDKRFSLFINEKNYGQAKSLNIGIKNAANDYIMFLDSDDILLETCFSNRLKFEFDTNDFLVFPNHFRFKKTIDNYSKIIEKKVRKNPLKDFITHNLPTPWNIMSMIWKKKSILKIDCFNENYVRLVDVEFSTKALILGLNYSIYYKKPDHFYRETLNETNVKIKRRNFYSASFTFISENSRLIDKISHPEKNKIKKYLFYFFLKTFMMTIISKEFDKKDSRLLFNFGQKNNLLNKSKRYLSFLIKLKPIIEIKIVRSVFWRFTNFYINHK